MCQVAENWWFHARQCRLVAGTLKSACIRIMAPLLPMLDAMLNRRQITNEMRGDWNPFILEAHQAVAEQLAGYALENAFKAAIVSRNPRVPGKHPGTLRERGLDTHALVTLKRPESRSMLGEGRSSSILSIWSYSNHDIRWRRQQERLEPFRRQLSMRLFAIVDEIMSEVKEMLKQDGRNLNDEFEDSGA